MFLFNIIRGAFKTIPKMSDGDVYKNSGFQPLTIYAKSSIIDVWQGCDYSDLEKQAVDLY